jgi:uncharacterized membrane protein YkvA (DUF1232 family)
MENIEIEVKISSRSITSAIGRELLNNDIEIEGDDNIEQLVENQVRTNFQQKLQLNQALFQQSSLAKKFTVEVRDDMGEIRPRALAAFHTIRSHHEQKPHFSVSSHLVFAELLRTNNVALEKFSLTCESYWSHELIHLRDWDLLVDNYQDLESAQKRVFSRCSGVLSQKSSSLPREWELLLVLSAYRDEGLAVLFEYLADDEPINISLSTAKQQFKQIFSFVSQLASRNMHDAWAKDAGSKKYNEHLPTFKKLAYSVGPYWVMSAIFSWAEQTNNTQLQPLLSSVMQKMAVGEKADITRTQAIEIINAGLNLDLGSYVDLLSNQELKQPWGLFIDRNSVLNLYNFISNEGTGEFSQFLEKIIHCILNQDATMFLTEVNKVITTLISLDDINKYELALDNSKSSINLELNSRILGLITFLQTNPDDNVADIALAALSYYFDEKDFIKDEIPHIGLIDDLYVLRAACVLLNIHSNDYS